MNRPVLRFSPTAWAKLLFLRDAGETEVGGFAIATNDDQLLVENVQLVRQTCTPVSVAFEDEAVADFFDHQVDAGMQPERFARIWVHTHPGDCPAPSPTDEDTFERVFGHTEWAVMFILAQGGQTYARLRFHVGPGGEIEIPVTVDYSKSFAASDPPAWQQEYQACVVDISALCPSLNAVEPRDGEFDHDELWNPWRHAATVDNDRLLL